MSYICPVCGFAELKEDPNSISSFEICPSCFFQFRYDDNDRGFTYEQWRKQWIAQGMRWAGGKRIKAPEGWNPQKQLLNIGINIE